MFATSFSASFTQSDGCRCFWVSYLSLKGFPALRLNMLNKFLHPELKPSEINFSMVSRVTLTLF